MKTFFILVVSFVLLLSVNANKNLYSIKNADNFNSLMKQVTCPVCKAGVSAFRATFVSDTFANLVGQTIQKLCDLAFSDSQCFKLVDAYKDMLKEGLRSKTFETNFFCEITVSACENTHYKKISFQDYADRVLADKPDIIKSNDFIDKLYQKIDQDQADGKERETMIIYHLSDLHWDLQYQSGTSDT